MNRAFGAKHKPNSGSCRVASDNFSTLPNRPSVSRRSLSGFDFLLVDPMLQFPDPQRRGQEAFRARNSFVGFIGGKFLANILVHIVLMDVVLVRAALTRTTRPRLRRSHAARALRADGSVMSVVHSDRAAY